MTQVVGIEFCAEFFKDEKACMDWIAQSEWPDLGTRVKGMKLKKNNNARILTPERKRQVWQWNNFYGSADRLEIKRYSNAPVVVVVCVGKKFAPTDYPPLLKKTIEHESQKKKRHEERVAKQRAEKRAKQEANPEASTSKKRKRSTTKGGKKQKKEESALVQQYGVNLDK